MPTTPPNRTARPRQTGGTPAAGNELVVKAGGITKFVETYATDLGRVAPKHISMNAFMGLATAYVRRDVKLRAAAEVNPGSLILALRECAALGHTPMPKTFALVPFNDKNAPGGKTIVGIETYHGVIERMYRAGAVQAVKSELVRETDVFVWDALNQRVVRHEYDPMASDEQRGPLAGTYAWAVMRGGNLSQVVWLNSHEVAKHRNVARTDAFWSGDWEPDMWRKTGLLKLENYVPTSAEYLHETAVAAAAASTGFAGVPDASPFPTVDDGIYDAVVVDDPPQQRAEPAQREQQPAGDTATGDWPKVPTIPGSSQDAANQVDGQVSNDG